MRYDQPLYRPPSEGRNLIIQASRVFLADGDALVLPTEDLAAILDRLVAAASRAVEQPVAAMGIMVDNRRSRPWRCGLLRLEFASR